MRAVVVLAVMAAACSQNQTCTDNKANSSAILSEYSVAVGDFDFPNWSFGDSATVSNVTGTYGFTRFQVNCSGGGELNPSSVRLNFETPLPSSPHGIAVLRAADASEDFGYGVQVDATAQAAILTYRNLPKQSRSYYFDMFLTL